MSIPSTALIGGALTDRTEADVLALPLLPCAGDGPPRVGAGGTDVEAAFALDLSVELATRDASGAAGRITTLHVGAEGLSARTLHLVGTGDASATSLRRAGAALARAARGADRLATTLGSVEADQTGDAAGAADRSATALRAFLEGLTLAAYSFSRTSAPRRPAPVAAVEVVVEDPVALQQACDRALATARGVHLARDLANTPPQEKDPAWLAARSREVAAANGLRVRVRDAAELAREGFGGILAVGRGSSRPPCLIELDYDPGAAARRGPHVVLVGKGITFDTGGLSLKPRESMTTMKTDMAAGGAVIAVLGAVAELGLGVRVTALVPAAENMPGADAYRPSDVIAHYGGTTSEVMNTDAEGRLVLADALAYADAVLHPDVLVDLATLTGAASLGLGRRHAALYTADEALLAALQEAAEDSGERVWHMPLVEDYRPSLSSEVADLCHISRDPKISGGSITAALFLREFVGARRWAHLDIAGPARADSDEHEVTKGGTGYGVRLLLRWLEALADPASAGRSRLSA